MKPSQFFALSGVIEAYQDAGEPRAALGWADIVDKAVSGQLPAEALNSPLLPNQRHVDLIEGKDKAKK